MGEVEGEEEEEEAEAEEEAVDGLVCMDPFICPLRLFPH
jgi:hypothetical protein